MSTEAAVLRTDRGPPPSPTGLQAASRLLGGAMEALVLALVCLAPWPYGSVHPAFEFPLDAGVAALVALWGGGLAKARWDGPAPSEVLPFDAPTTTQARTRSPERADLASPVADDDSVLEADRWVPSIISPFR